MTQVSLSTLMHADVMCVVVLPMKTTIINRRGKSLKNKQFISSSHIANRFVYLVVKRRLFCHKMTV